MVQRLSIDARRRVLDLAAQEARDRGDRRIGTDHLLLALLNDASALPARVLDTDLTAARAACVELDRAALSAVGVDVDHLGPPRVVANRRRPPFSSGARALLARGVAEARASRARRIETRHLLIAVLSCERPDPAAELMAALGVDRRRARARLDADSGAGDVAEPEAAESRSESESQSPSRSESQSPSKSESESQSPSKSESESQSPSKSESESQSPSKSESESESESGE